LANFDLNDENRRTIYKKLAERYPDCAPEAIEASIQCISIGAHLSLRRERFCHQFGITPGQFSLLLLLWYDPNHRMAPSEIAAQANVTRATATHFIDELENGKLVIRADHPTDRRATWVELTQEGNDLLDKMLPLHLENLKYFTQVLSPVERAEFASLVTKLGEGLLQIEEEANTKKQSGKKTKGTNLENPAATLP
jgi:DNA-binding MarR family transcriptional regulator